MSRDVQISPLTNLMRVQCQHEGCTKPAEFFCRRLLKGDGKFFYMMRKLCPQHKDLFEQQAESHP